MKKIIALDLDGTLLRRDKTVSQYTIDILLKFKEKNNKIVFATARPPRDAYKYVPEVLRDNPIICYNGACIFDGKEMLYKKQMTKQDTLEIMKVAQKFGYHQVSIEIDDTLYSNFDTFEFFGTVPNKIVNLEAMEFEKAYKVIICSKNPIIKEFTNALPISCKGIITDGGTLCQIMNRESSKWMSIKSLIQKIGIGAENIIAFGDDYNDFDMIKNSGIGVAMGNAEESIKQIADIVIDTNNEDGVAKYIAEEILEK